LSLCGSDVKSNIKVYDQTRFHTPKKSKLFY